MSEPMTQAHGNAAPVQFDRKRVYFVLQNPGRRRLLLALAQGRTVAASDIKTEAGCSRDATSKQFALMRKAGFVVIQPDPQNRRRSLVALAPWVPVKVTPTGKVIDFGFIKVRVKVTS